MTLPDLLCLLESAEVPNFALEEALWYKLVFDPALDRKDDSYLKLVGRRPGAYTASLDAAMALVERVLQGAGVRPGWPLWLVTVTRFYNGQWSARLYRTSDGLTQTAEGNTPALAVVVALLRAKISVEAT